MEDTQGMDKVIFRVLNLINEKGCPMHKSEEQKNIESVKQKAIH